MLSREAQKDLWQLTWEFSPMEFFAPFIAYKESQEQLADQVMSPKLSGINPERSSENFWCFLLNEQTDLWGYLERLLNFKVLMDCGELSDLTSRRSLDQVNGVNWHELVKYTQEQKGLWMLDNYL